MYDPKGNGRDRTAAAVRFAETLPPDHLRSVAHRFIELQTETLLDADYCFHALPDACAYIVFDQQNPAIAACIRKPAVSF